MIIKFALVSFTFLFPLFNYDISLNFLGYSKIYTTSYIQADTEMSENLRSIVARVDQDPIVKTDGKYQRTGGLELTKKSLLINEYRHVGSSLIEVSIFPIDEFKVESMLVDKVQLLDSGESKELEVISKSLERNSDSATFAMIKIYPVHFFEEHNILQIDGQLCDKKSICEQFAATVDFETKEQEESKFLLFHQ